MRPRGQPCHAHKTDNLPLPYFLPVSQPARIPGKMGIKRFQPAAMAHDNLVAIAARPMPLCDDAVAHSLDGRSRGRGVINAFVRSAIA